MKKSQALKKCFAMLIALAMVGVFVVTGYAASYTTTTTYDVAEGVVGVTTEVTGAKPDEQVTYLAYDQDDEVSEGVSGPYANETGFNIVYIDQVQANSSGKAVFDYSVAIANIGTTAILLGAEETASITPATEGTDDTIQSYTVTATVGNYGVLDANIKQTLDGEDCIFTITPNTGYTVASIVDRGNPVNLNNVIVQNDGTIYYTVKNVTADTTLTVTFDTAEEPEVSVPTVSPALVFAGADTLDQSGASNVTVYSKVELPSGVTESSVEYGILFSFSENPTFANFNNSEDLTDDIAETTSFSLSAPVAGTRKYRALGKGLMGNYAVQLIDSGNKLTGKTYYIRPYIVTDDNYAGATYGTQIIFN